MSYSERKTGLFGDKYTKHYDKNWNTKGYSQTKTGLFGAKYTKHYDKNWNAR